MQKIHGYTHYLIDRDGNVFSQTLSQRSQKSTWLRNGYKCVTLYEAGVKRNEYIHKLLLETYVGKRPRGTVCRHIDGNKFNNSLTNICWGTYSQNQLDRITAGNHNRGERHGMNKYSREFVEKVRTMVKGTRQKDVAKELGISASTVSSLVTTGWKWL